MTDRLYIARCSLGLFIAGPLMPLLAVMLGSRDSVAIAALGLGATVELLALVLGIVGRQHLAGKIGLFGSLLVLVGFGMLLPLLMFRSYLSH